MTMMMIMSFYYSDVYYDLDSDDVDCYSDDDKNYYKCNDDDDDNQIMMMIIGMMEVLIITGHVIMITFVLLHFSA